MKIHTRFCKTFFSHCKLPGTQWVWNILHNEIEISSWKFDKKLKLLNAFQVPFQIRDPVDHTTLYQFREIIIAELDFAKDEFIQLQTSARRARVVYSLN